MQFVKNGSKRFDEPFYYLFFVESCTISLGIDFVNLFFRESHSLSSFYPTLLGDQPSKEPLSCLLCGNRLHHFGKDGSLRQYMLLEHACSHFGKKLLTCNHCGYAAATRQQMRRHVQEVHKLIFSKEQYIDLRSTHHSEIKDVLKRCFGQQGMENNSAMFKENWKYVLSFFPSCIWLNF